MTFEEKLEKAIRCYKNYLVKDAVNLIREKIISEMSNECDKCDRIIY